MIRRSGKTKIQILSNSYGNYGRSFVIERVSKGEEILRGSSPNDYQHMEAKDKVEEQRKGNERLNTELTKKDSGMKELQAQRLGVIKMESQVQVKQLQQWKEKTSKFLHY